jgi:hypothetical protein
MKRRSFLTASAALGMSAVKQIPDASVPSPHFHLGCVTYNLLKKSKGTEIWMEVHGRDTQEPKTSAESLVTTDHKNVGACWNSNPTDVRTAL